MLEQIAGAVGGNRIKTAINPGEGAFYGPKFEYVLRDAIGRDWQCGTTQVDFNLPERFGAFYIDADGEKKQPVMVHRAICGSMERFIGILIEHYAGHFPLWLAPVQVVVATITSDADDYASRWSPRAARRAGLRAEIDLRNEKINYKVREHSLAKVPVMLVVGKKEAESARSRSAGSAATGQTVMPLDEALAALVDEATPPDVKRSSGLTKAPHQQSSAGSLALPLETGCAAYALGAATSLRAANAAHGFPMPDTIELLKTRRSVKPMRDDRPRPLAGRARDHSDHRRARAGSRQARAVALHRVRGRRARPRRRDLRAGLREEESRRATAEIRSKKRRAHAMRRW